jgi:hypothetical protein
MGQPEIEQQEIDSGVICADFRQQLGRAAHGDRVVSGVLEHRAEPLAHESGIVGDQDSLGSHVVHPVPRTTPPAILSVIIAILSRFPTLHGGYPDREAFRRPRLIEP